MADLSFLLQAHKFSPDSIGATLVCLKCDEVFRKEFPLELEGQTVRFKCPVCGAFGEADIPYKSAVEREEIRERLEEAEELEEDEETIAGESEEIEYAS